MFKRLLPLLLALCLLPSAVLADPLPLLDDYAEDFAIPYEEGNPEAGVFRYSCRYPHPDPEAKGGESIDLFYRELIDYELGFTIPMFQDAFEGMDSSISVDYTVTCSNEEYFSVLIRTERENPDQHITIWEGHVFSREHSVPGYTCSLPKYLGILAAEENEEWLQTRQTEKADRLIREMVWARIEDNRENRDYGALTEEGLAEIFFPEEDFYLDENGDPVFYLQPWDVYADVPEDAALLTFSIPLEEILDEL